MRNIDQHVADLGIQQLAFACLDTYTAVFDVDLAIHPGQRRPARLERQRCVVDVEEQADDTRRIGRVLVQRPLILEETLLDRATDHGGAQPVIKLRTERCRQVLAGVTAVAVDHTDPQIHVVFLIMIEVNLDQKVRRNLAFVAEHLDVRGNQRERLVIQFPGQTGIGLPVTPRLGEDRVQVQHEVIGVEAQLALPQIAADGTADVSGRRRPAIRVETHLVQIGGKAQALVTDCLWPVVEQYVTQPACHLEAVDHCHGLFRQGRE